MRGPYARTVSDDDNRGPDAPVAETTSLHTTHRVCTVVLSICYAAGGYLMLLIISPNVVWSVESVEGSRRIQGNIAQARRFEKRNGGIHCLVDRPRDQGSGMRVEWGRPMTTTSAVCL